MGFEYRLFYPLTEACFSLSKDALVSTDSKEDREDLYVYYPDSNLGIKLRGYKKLEIKFKDGGQWKKVIKVKTTQESKYDDITKVIRGTVIKVLEENTKLHPDVIKCLQELKTYENYTIVKIKKIRHNVLFEKTFVEQADIIISHEANEMKYRTLCVEDKNGEKIFEKLCNILTSQNHQFEIMSYPELVKKFIYLRERK